MRLPVVLSLALVACGPARQPVTPQPSRSAEPLASFSLLDVNPASPTAGQRVGPQDFRGRVSGWYFTHSS